MQQDNISGFANVSTSLMIDFMLVIIDHPHGIYANCIFWIAFFVTSLCKKLVVKHSESDLYPVQQ